LALFPHRFAEVEAKREAKVEDVTMPDDRDDGADGADDGGFGLLGLRPELRRALAQLGYEEPTPIQREAIPPLVAGRDLLGQAATGTGKTAAFALPLLQRLTADRREPEPAALVLVPTRELAVQVSEAVHRYGRELHARVVPIYGGQPIGRQLHALERGVDVVVATPGRAIDHIGRGTLPLHRIATVVLDEADEMLDMGFADEIEQILATTPETRQTVLFSATLPSRIDAIARRHLRDPVRISIERESTDDRAVPLVRQVAYVVPRAHKATALGRVLDVEAPEAALVFCRTRTEVDQLTETLNGRGYRAEALHGGMDQAQRDRVMGRLRGGTADLVVATDVAARGLDVDVLTHVVNYDVPSAPESYVHRIGRVGRAGREGVAITLAEPREHRLLQNIERATRQKIAIQKVPSVDDLRARQLELTTETLRDALEASDDGQELDHFRVVIDALEVEHDILRIALAAVKVAHEATATGDDDVHIPDVELGRPRPAAPASRDRRPRGGRDGMTRLYVSAGRSSGIRPQDLVGAIAGESGIRGRDIGAIEISDRFSLVEVPDASADAVVAAMRGVVIKGRKVTVRRERW
jgi:ATP-dependent RNA helicase DeaD